MRIDRFGRTLRCLSLGVAGALLTSVAAAQEPAEPIESFGEELAVDVVNVEAWVTDRKGQPVTGLTAADFDLLVDGEPVEIRYFSSFSGSADSGAPAAATPAPKAGDGAPAAEEVTRVVVLVDDWNLRPEDRARVMGDLRSFLDREVGPREQVMVVVHTGASISIAQELTSDREALARSLDRVEAASTTDVRLDVERRQTIQEVRRAIEEAGALAERLAGATARGASSTGADVDLCRSAWPQMEAAYRNYAAGVAGRARASASALVSVIQAVGGLPGSKVMLYVGNGLPDQPALDIVELLHQVCPHLQSDIQFLSWDYDLNPLYDQVVERANANRITLYMLEAEGPDQTLDDGPGDARYRLSAQAYRMREISNEAGLSRLADETGGRAILDAADFDWAFDGIGRDLRNYYSLGFSPASGAGTGKHRLEVRLKKPRGYLVRHRASYQDKPFEQRMMERVYAVAGLGGESNPLGVRIETGDAVIDADGMVSIPVRIWTPLDGLTLTPAGDGAEGRLRLMMTVTDASGIPGPIRQKAVPVAVSATGEDESAPGTRAKLVEVNLRLPPGHHRVAIGLRDELGGEICFLRHDLEIAASPRDR